MHELGILRQIVKIVEQTAVKNGIEHVRNITLEIGRDSEVIPSYHVNPKIEFFQGFSRFYPRQTEPEVYGYHRISY